MATLNVGSMAARLGLDPSEFLDKMKGVQGFNSDISSRMAREWKNTSRTGAESLRLVDEALGIHLSRPLTRILTQELPQFGKAMGSILGGSVFAALGVAAFEFGQRMVKAIEKATAAQEEFRRAGVKVAETLGLDL